VRHVRARDMLAKLGLGANVGSNIYHYVRGTQIGVNPACAECILCCTG
jgi:hypothetical protein